jgi:hypothetical protein
LAEVQNHPIRAHPVLSVVKLLFRVIRVIRGLSSFPNPSGKRRKSPLDSDPLSASALPAMSSSDFLPPYLLRAFLNYSQWRAEDCAGCRVDNDGSKDRSELAKVGVMAQVRFQ